MMKIQRQHLLFLILLLLGSWMYWTNNCHPSLPLRMTIPVTITRFKDYAEELFFDREANNEPPDQNLSPCRPCNEFGQGELQQLTTFLKTRPFIGPIEKNEERAQIEQKDPNAWTIMENLTKRRKKEAHSIAHDVAYISTEAEIILRISEYVYDWSGEEWLWSGGGSSFRIEIKGTEWADCKYLDHANGSYTACCPVVSRCANITVHLQFANYDAYKFHHLQEVMTPLFKKVYHRLWCPNVTKSKPAGQETHHSKDGKQGNDVRLRNFKDDVATRTTSHSGTVCDNVSSQDYLEGRWHRQTSGEWRWGSQNGCLFQFLSKDESISCFDKLSSVTLIGDSHIRNTGDYYLELLGINMSRVVYHRHYDLLPSPHSKLQILFGGFPDLVADKLANLSNIRTSQCDVTKTSNDVIKTRKDVIVISTGAWDLWMNGWSHYLYNSSRRILDQISHLKADHRWRNARMIWMNNVAFPSSVFGPSTGYRNNFIQAACNSALDERFKALGVEVVNAERVTRARDDDKVCGWHYVCRTKHDNFAQSVGNTGMTLAQLLLRRICAF